MAAKALRYRLFKVGRMPETLKQASPGAIVAEEGIPVRANSRSVRLPGLRTGRGVNLLTPGSLVIHSDRVLAAVGKNVIVDSPVPAAGGEGQTLNAAADGIRIAIDIKSVFAPGAGSVELRFGLPLEPAVLASVPTGPIELSDVVPVLIRNWC